jgi:nucleoid-associated protein YgaU
MTELIALTSTKAPERPGAASPVSKAAVPQTAAQHAQLVTYDAVPATGGSKTGGGKKDTIDFQFNPKEVSITKSAKWDRKPGKRSKQAGPPEFAGSEPCKMTLELFFDATLKTDVDVVKSVESLFACCVPTDPKAKKPMPPLVVFTWGGLSSFPAFVTQVSAKYTLFAANGVPIRAVCSVTLEEMPGEPRKQNPSSGALTTRKVHNLVDGDNLALLAYREYGDPTMWRPLADYNGVDDPMRLRPGTRVVLPAIEDLLARAERTG